MTTRGHLRVWSMRKGRRRRGVGEVACFYATATYDAQWWTAEGQKSSIDHWWKWERVWNWPWNMTGSTCSTHRHQCSDTWRDHLNNYSGSVPGQISPFFFVWCRELCGTHRYRLQAEQRLTLPKPCWRPATEWHDCNSLCCICVVHGAPVQDKPNGETVWLIVSVMRRKYLPNAPRCHLNIRVRPEHYKKTTLPKIQLHAANLYIQKDFSLSLFTVGEELQHMVV